MPEFTIGAMRVDPYKNFKFRVKWDGTYVAGISTDRIVGQADCDPAQARIFAFSRSNSSAVMTPRSRRSASLAS
jgi:hypothetical protein